MRPLLNGGCIAKWLGDKPPSGPARPRMIRALSVELSKPRLIDDAWPLNGCTQAIPFKMDTWREWRASIASSGCYMTSLDAASVFHHTHCVAPRISNKGVDYIWCVLPFGFSLSPWVYHTLDEAKTVYQRSKGIATLAHLDDT